MVQTGRKVDLCICKGCFYYRTLSAGGIKACHYSIDNDDVRGVKPSECYKQEGTPYLPKAKGRRKKATMPAIIFE